MLNHNHIFNDPIHGVMDFNENQKQTIIKYIDTDIFQRLRRINQLGFTDYVFPGATHSRFSHSIGACFIAKNLCKNLNSSFANKEEINATILAALLHDIGHGPFSHSFEYILNYNLPVNKKVSHDHEWKIKFFEDLAKNSPVFQEEITAVNKIFSSIDNFNKTMVSSQLDVDRLDYLLRDSHFCGVPYGKIDLRWILKSIDTVEIENYKHLVVQEKGIGAVEHYLSARRLMNKNIYYNPKVCAVQYYFKEFILSLEEDINSNNITENNLIKFLTEYFKYASDDSATPMNFVNNAYELYKTLTDDDIFMQLKIMSENKGNTKSKTIAKCLLERKLPDCFIINNKKCEKIKSEIQNIKSNLPKNESWKLEIEKFGIKTYKENENPIYINHNGKIKNISAESEVLNFHSAVDEEKYILYIDPTLKNYNDLIKLINEF